MCSEDLAHGVHSGLHRARDRVLEPGHRADLVAVGVEVWIGQMLVEPVIDVEIRRLLLSRQLSSPPQMINSHEDPDLNAEATPVPGLDADIQGGGHEEILHDVAHPTLQS